MVGNIKQPLPPWDEVEVVRERRGLCRGQRGGLPPAECFYEVLWAGSGFIWKSWRWRTKRKRKKKFTLLWRDNRCMLRTCGKNCAQDAVIGFEVFHGLSCRREMMENDNKFVDGSMTGAWLQCDMESWDYPTNYIYLAFTDRAVAHVLSSLPT